MTNNCIEALKRHQNDLQKNDVHEFYIHLNEDMSSGLLRPEEIGMISSYLLNKSQNSKKLLLENLIAIPDYFLYAQDILWHEDSHKKRLIEEQILYAQDGSNFDIPRAVDLIGAKAFSHTKIDHLFIPGNVGVIQSLACNSNEYIEKITIEKGVRLIGDWAFGDCSRLTELIIPSSVIHIGREITQYSSNVTIYCNEGSEAHKYATEEHLRYILI